MARILAVDVGGTKVDAMVFGVAADDPGPCWETRETFETPEAGPRGHPEAARAAFVAWLRAIADRHGVDGWAMAVAGPLSDDRRQIFTCPNIPFVTDTRPEEWELGPLAGKPFALANDLEAAAAGEVRWGRYGLRERCALLDTISTGWGGALVLRGEVWPGEPGHNPYLLAGGAPCGCGRQGCFEAYFSGSAAARRVRERLAATGQPLPPEEDPNRILGEAAAAGEAWAHALLAEIATGIGLNWGATLNRLSRLDLILYMGGFAMAMMPYLLPTIRATIARVSRFPRHASDDGLPIRPATFTVAPYRNPSLVGGAAVWLDRYG